MNTEQNKIRKAKKGEFEWRKLTIGFNEIEYDLCHICHENRNDWNKEIEITLVNLKYCKNGRKINIIVKRGKIFWA